jgi:hypothetical protein
MGRCLLLVLNLLLRLSPHLYLLRNQWRDPFSSRQMVCVAAPQDTRAGADTGASAARSGAFAEARPSTAMRSASRGLVFVRRIMHRFLCRWLRTVPLLLSCLHLRLRQHTRRLPPLNHHPLLVRSLTSPSQAQHHLQSLRSNRSRPPSRFLSLITAPLSRPTASAALKPGTSLPLPVSHT